MEQHLKNSLIEIRSYLTSLIENNFDQIGCECTGCTLKFINTMFSHFIAKVLSDFHCDIDNATRRQEELHVFWQDFTRYYNHEMEKNTDKVRVLQDMH